MLFNIALNYIQGYLKISVEGYFIERFINICISKNIILWGIKREKSSFLYANISKKDFKRLKQIAKKTRCRVKIEEKKGIPFLIHRYKKRKIFFTFLVIILFSIYISSHFLWNIEILGCTKINPQELEIQLSKIGLSTGVYKRKIDTKKIINQIRLNRNDIAWIGIDISGTNAIINIVEADEKPEIINESEYCNIISNKAGVITKIVPQNGTALVKVGDIVKEGSILIGGWIEGKFTGTRYVHGTGEVQAKVWYSKKESIKLINSVNEQTGEEEKKYSINFNNFKINLGKSIPKFKKYDTINEKKKIKLFSNFYLPIEIEKNTYKQVETKQVIYEETEAVEMLTDQIDKELLEQIKEQKNIVNKQVNTNNKDGYIEVEVIYEVLENIGTKEKIIF